MGKKGKTIPVNAQNMPGLVWLYLNARRTTLGSMAISQYKKHTLIQDEDWDLDQEAA